MPGRREREGRTKEEQACSRERQEQQKSQRYGKKSSPDNRRGVTLKASLNPCPNEERMKRGRMVEMERGAGWGGGGV